MIILLKFKKYFIFAGSIIIINILLSLIYLLTNIPYNIISSITIIFNLLFFGILGFMIAKRSKSKGIIVGLKVSSITIITLIILTLIFKLNFDAKNIIYYLLITLSIIFGAIISKNIKRQ